MSTIDEANRAMSRLERNKRAQEVVDRAYAHTVDCRVENIWHNTVLPDGTLWRRERVRGSQGVATRETLFDQEGKLRQVATDEHLSPHRMLRHAIRRGVEEAVAEVPHPDPVVEVMLRRGLRSYVDYERGQRHRDPDTQEETWELARVRVYADGEAFLHDEDGQRHRVEVCPRP